MVNLYEAHGVQAGTSYEFQPACPKEWKQATGSWILSLIRLRALYFSSEIIPDSDF